VGYLIDTARRRRQMADTSEPKYRRVARRAPERGPGFIESYYGPLDLSPLGPGHENYFGWHPGEDASGDGPEQGRTPRGYRVGTGAASGTRDW
jgi:hypothetical protein